VFKPHATPYTSPHVQRNVPAGAVALGRTLLESGQGEHQGAIPKSGRVRQVVQKWS
jgi:hypothetical protein